ncbi:MAG: hypothetical protein ACOCUI_01470 [bacterium]
MAITNNPMLNDLINNRTASGKRKNDHEYCIKCGKYLVKTNKDNKGNDIPENVLKFMDRVGLCIECFNAGPNSPENKPNERKI